MRVGAIQPREVPVQATHATPAQLRAAIAAAYVRVTGKQPTKEALDAISAQAMVETARGTSMINFNFGGIKGASPEGLTARARTVEIVGGQTKHIVDGFRAYGSLEAGATDYLHTLHDRFSAAFARADAGDIDGFAHELKRAHYFTAGEADYARALHAQSGTATSASTAEPMVAARPADGAPDRFARAEEITRILDALASSAARILEDDESA